MITKIVGASFMFMLILAFFLSLVGITADNIDGQYFYSFLNNLNRYYQGWKIEIPNIPKINQWQLAPDSSGDNIFEAFRSFVNILINIINVIISVVNVFILIINVVISIIQVICTTIYCIKDLFTLLKDNPLSVVKVIT